jgi:predicted DCC family thiol-disulfide oxidoreductase YuxK
VEKARMQSTKSKNIILFDGVCNLCNGFVNFVVKRDRKGVFVFASLQSETAKKLMEQFNLSPTDFDSIILIKESSYYIKSEAALKIAKELSCVWPFFYIFIILPQGWRDKIYDFIVKNRYRWFGQLEQCMIPSDDLRGRFLD